MKLSELVYLIVKNVKYLDDTNFMYEAFIRGEFNEDYDYKNSINNVFTPLNRAIHRLSDLRKIATKTIDIDAPSAVNEYDLGESARDIKTIVGVSTMVGYDMMLITYRRKSKDKLYCKGVSGRITVEYIQDIPNFKESDITYSEATEELKDIDLYEYGITETMTSYIIEYCQGILFETISPEIANKHLTIAEQYFNDLEEFEMLSLQDCIYPTMYIE